MRRSLSILLLVLIGISPIGSVGRSASAQEPESIQERLEACQEGGLIAGEGDAGTWWTGVCRPIPILGAQLSISQPPLMQPYLVKFAEEYAATDPLIEAEYMVVVVMEGYFALDLESDEEGLIVVSSPAGAIAELSRIPVEPHYELTGGSIPCDPECTLSPEQPVLLARGDVAVVKPGTICLWCLLGLDLDWQQKNMEPGLLGVFARLEESDDPESFSWFQDWETIQQGQQGRGREEQTTRAWAFNPHSTRCNGG